jgi:hypothetical protein
MLAVAPIESRSYVEMVGVDIASEEVGSSRIRTAHQTVTGKEWLREALVYCSLADINE